MRLIYYPVLLVYLCLCIPINGYAIEANQTAYTPYDLHCMLGGDGPPDYVFIIQDYGFDFHIPWNSETNWLLTDRCLATVLNKPCRFTQLTAITIKRYDRMYIDALSSLSLSLSRLHGAGSTG